MSNCNSNMSIRRGTLTSKKPKCSHRLFRGHTFNFSAQLTIDHTLNLWITSSDRTRLSENEDSPGDKVLINRLNKAFQSESTLTLDYLSLKTISMHTNDIYSISSYYMYIYLVVYLLYERVSVSTNDTLALIRT